MHQEGNISAFKGFEGSRLVLLCLITLFFGLAGLFTLPPLDRDESRFVQASTQMLETNDYVNIKFQQRERNKKPVGIYWLQSASVSLFSDVEKREIWAYRLPSLFSAIGSVALTYLFGCALFSGREGFWGALLLSASPVFLGEATIAKTDATLLLSIIASQFFLYLIYKAKILEKNRPSLLICIGFWVSLSFGILIKGPITPMVSFLTILTLSGRHLFTKDGFPSLFGWAASFRPILGLIIIVALVGPWMVGIGISTEGRFFTEAIGGDMMGKLSQIQESHAGPPGYYLLLVWILFWPISLFLPLALQKLPTVFFRPSIFFLISWIVLPWTFFELASTKLPHYTMPLYPAIALLVAHIILSYKDDKGAADTLCRILGSTIFLAVGIGLAVSLHLTASNLSYSGSQIILYLLLASAVITGLTGAILLLKRRMKTAMASASLLSAITCGIMFQAYLPHLEALNMSSRISTTIDELGYHPRLDEYPEPVSLVGYHEPSLIFQLATNTRTDNPHSSAHWVKATPNRIAVVEQRTQELFLKEVGAENVEALKTLSGYNYSNAKDVVLTIYISK